MPAKFELYKDRQGEFRFRLTAPNGQTVATGEGYTTKRAALNGIASIQKNAPIAQIDDQTEATKPAKNV